MANISNVVSLFPIEITNDIAYILKRKLKE